MENGASLTSAIELVSEFRKTDSSTPVVLMGYANPIERMGYADLAARAAAAGVDGILTVDLPPEEAQNLNQQLKSRELENIFLVAPTTTDSRIGSITALAGGFVYYVSLKGVTGAGHLDVDSVSEKMQQIRTHTDLPVLVGFGIKDKTSAKAIGACADGVVVGSLFVNAMGGAATESVADICAKLRDLVVPIREGLNEL